MPNSLSFHFEMGFVNEAQNLFKFSLFTDFVCKMVFKVIQIHSEVEYNMLQSNTDAYNSSLHQIIVFPTL